MLWNEMYLFFTNATFNKVKLTTTYVPIDQTIFKKTTTYVSIDYANFKKNPDP